MFERYYHIKISKNDKKRHYDVHIFFVNLIQFLQKPNTVLRNDMDW